GSMNGYTSNIGMKQDQVNPNYGQGGFGQQQEQQRPMFRPQLQSQTSQGSNYGGSRFLDQSRSQIGSTFQRKMMFDQQQRKHSSKLATICIFHVKIVLVVAGMVEPNIKFLEDIKGSVNEISLEEKLANMSSNYVFDFKNAQVGVSTGNGGRVVSANARNFPILINHKIAMTVGFLEPCGMNLPHVHPRATEINYAAKGDFQTGFFQENGGKFVGHIVREGQVSVFPQGAIHFEQNMGCETAMFVAAFDHEDPGTLTIADGFFSLPTDILAASLGGISEDDVMRLGSNLPKNAGFGTEECLIRCGLKPQQDRNIDVRQPVNNYEQY
ncbi:unnamed protein product, partial [Didymodactylos carnosus]